MKIAPITDPKLREQLEIQIKNDLAAAEDHVRQAENWGLAALLHAERSNAHATNAETAAEKAFFAKFFTLRAAIAQAALDVKPRGRAGARA